MDWPSLSLSVFVTYSTICSLFTLLFLRKNDYSINYPPSARMGTLSLCVRVKFPFQRNVSSRNFRNGRVRNTWDVKYIIQEKRLILHEQTKAYIISKDTIFRHCCALCAQSLYKFYPWARYTCDWWSWGRRWRSCRSTSPRRGTSKVMIILAQGHEEVDDLWLFPQRS